MICVTKMSICHDVRYDGESVMLFDGIGQLIGSHRALLFRGAPEIVKRAGGSHVVRLNDSESLVVNPDDVSQLGAVSGYQWYVKNCMMKEINCTMFTSWKPIFIIDPPGITRSIGTQRQDQPSSPENVTLSTKGSMEEYYIVPSIKSPIYAMKRNTVTLVPLLETLVHVNQAWSHMTLCQIACSITGYFKAEFNDMFALMRFLFEHTRDVFAKLCRTENTPLHKLHQSDFNLTFGHNQSKSPNVGMIRVMKRLENVVMVPLSSVVNKKTYGDIPWLITDPHEKDLIMRKAKFISHPFGFFENSVQYTELEGSILFRNVCILPEVIIDENLPPRSSSNDHNSGDTLSSPSTVRYIYPAGAMLGIVVYDDGTKDTIFRGQLFDNISTKEQMILTFLFNAYVEGQLNQIMDCSHILRTLPLYEEQLRMRKPFIEAIQRVLFSNT